MERKGRYEFKVYYKDELTASVVLDYENNTVDYERYTHINTHVPYAFDDPTVEQMEAFIKSRCMDYKREQLQEYLSDLEIDVYDEFEIVKKTHGVMWEDLIWLKFPDEELAWKDVRIRE